jgi:predicted RNase H-like HicB family nuclease
MTFKVELLKTETGYAAGCPDLPGFVSQGETEDQVLQNIRTALGEQVISRAGEQEAGEIRYIDIPYIEPHDLQQQRRKHGFLKIRPFTMNLPHEWTSGKIEDLFDLLDTSSDRDHH